MFLRSKKQCNVLYWSSYFLATSTKQTKTDSTEKLQSTLCPQKRPLCDCLYLCQLLTDFQNSFTGTFCGQLAKEWLLNIPPNVNCVTTLPCKI